VETAQTAAALALAFVENMNAVEQHGSANDKGPRISSNRHSVAGLVGSVPRVLQQDKNIWRQCGRV